jgi:two-component system sensor histidine kinase SenX3
MALGRRRADEERLTDALNRAARAEAELARLAVLVPALEAVPVGFVVVDTHGSELVRNALAVAPVGELQADALVAGVVQDVLTLALRGEPVERRVDLHGPPACSMLVSASPLPDGGAVAVVADVSERRHVEAMRRDFVTNVNHELRTPVGALGLLAEALGDETDPAVVARLAGRISAEAERTRELLDDLLDFSRIEGNREPPNEVVDLARVAAAAAHRVEPAAERRGVAIHVDAPAVGLIETMGDEAQLVSAVANLLDNAVKYSDEDAAADVVVSVAGGSDEKTVEVVVRDSGIGIPAKDHGRIFERFYRVDPARGRGTGGSGLGLAIVRHVVTNHGGSVAVDSTEGVGSTFTIRLPRAVQP